jgi:hypothetical protein
LFELIVVHELGVGDQQTGPPPHPFVVYRELSRRLNGAAKVVRGRTIRSVAIGKVCGILLENAGGSDRVRTIQKTVSPFDFAQCTLFRGQQR